MKGAAMKTRLAALLLAATIAIIALMPCGVGAAGISYVPTSWYYSSKYYQRLKAVPLTGDKAFDIVNVASSQLGYCEGDDMTGIDGKNYVGSKNYTEYGYWFGTQVMGYDEGLWSAWCAFFISWCARQANVSEYVVCNAAYAKPDGASSVGFGYFHVDEISPRGFAPQCGDLIFFDWEAQGKWDHVGLVCYVDNGRVATVEGNAMDGTLLRVYDMNDPAIRAYGRPKYGDMQPGHAELIKAKCRTMRALRTSLDNVCGFLGAEPKK